MLYCRSALYSLRRSFCTPKSNSILPLIQLNMYFALCLSVQVMAYGLVTPVYAVSEIRRAEGLWRFERGIYCGL